MSVLRSFSTASAYDVTGNAASQPSLTIPAPGGIQDGDLMVALVAYAFPGASVTLPGGWTLKDSQSTATGGDVCLLYYKVASGESGNYTWTFASGGRPILVGIIGVWDGSHLVGVPSYSDQHTTSFSTTPTHTIPSHANALTHALAIYGILHVTGNDSGALDPVTVMPGDVTQVAAIEDWTHITGGSGPGNRGINLHLEMFESYESGTMAADTFGDQLGTSQWVYYRFVPTLDMGVVTDFSGAPLSGGAPLPISFTDESIGDPDSWAWDFGDGGTSTDQNPTHVYTEMGTYDVSLTVSRST